VSHYARADTHVDRFGWTKAVCGERVKDRDSSNDPTCPRCALWLKQDQLGLPQWARQGLTTTKETPVTDTQKQVVLIDLSSVAFPIYKTAERDVSGPGTTTNLTVQAIHEFTSGQPYSIVCCDSPKNFRKDIDASYKANREEKEAAYYHELKQIKKRLLDEGYPVWESEGFEADDVIATATVKAVQAGFDAVLIISADKDLLQLVDDAGNIQTKSPATGNLFNEAAVWEKFSVKPGQMVDYLSLLGDTSDNIKGADGIGKVNAAKLLAKYETVDAACAATESDPAAFKPATLASLKEFCSRKDTVRRLIELRMDVPVTFDLQPRTPKSVQNFRAETHLGTEMPSAEELSEAEAESPIVAQATPSKAVDAEVVEAKDSPMSRPVTEGAPAVKGADERMRQSVPSKTVDIEPSQALAVRDPAWLLAPRTLTEADKLSLRLFDSGLFSAYGTPQAVLSTVLFGQELGIPPMTALRSIHIIENKHSMSAQLIMGLVLKSGLCKKFELVETTNEKCTYIAQRVGGKPLTFTYSFEDAVRAGYVKYEKDGTVKQSSNWYKNPRNMCMWRCVTEICRILWPDICGNLYSPEELRDARS